MLLSYYQQLLLRKDGGDKRLRSIGPTALLLSYYQQLLLRKDGGDKRLRSIIAHPINLSFATLNGKEPEVIYIQQYRVYLENLIFDITRVIELERKSLEPFSYGT